MSTPVEPSLNRRKLRSALRKGRQGMSLTQQLAAEALEWSLSKIIRIETGNVGVSVTDLRAMLKLYDITDPGTVATLEEAARGSKGPSWWSSFHDVLNPHFAQYLGYETAASTLRTYHPIVIPGHLQTEQYATALLGESERERRRLERLVKLRMERRRRMFETESRPPARFYVDEAAVRRVIGGPETMREQLAQLEEYSARRDVSVRVLPFAAGAHFSTLGSFILLTFEEDDDLLYLENATGSMTGTEDRELLTKYQLCAGVLERKSLTDEDSLRLIRDIKGLYQSNGS